MKKDAANLSSQLDYTIFVSYSWDSCAHKTSVKKLVEKLRKDGLHVIYDGDLQFGDRITSFMENSIAKCNVVLFVCTPTYKLKADCRVGGVGYENSIITGELYESHNERKFIPVLFSGSWQESLPVWAKGKLGVDLSNPANFQANYVKLLDTLFKNDKPIDDPTKPTFEITVLQVPQHAKLLGFSEHMSICQVDNKFGYIDESGECIISPIFDYAGKFFNGYAVVGIGNIDIKNRPYLDSNGRYGYINKKGHFITPIHFSKAHNFSENLACVQKDGKFGYINEKNQTMIPFRFSFADAFSEGKACVVLDNNYYYIDAHGQGMSCGCNYAESFSDGMAYIEVHEVSGGFCGFIDRNDNIIYMPHDFDFCGFDFTESRCVVQRYSPYYNIFEKSDKKRYGYIDKSGALSIPDIYQKAFPFYDGRAVVSLENRFNVINLQGKHILPLSNDYDYIGNYCCGLALVQKNNKFGFIDRDGNVVISLDYDIAYPFDNYITLGYKHNKWYKIENLDKNEKLKNTRAVSFLDRRKFHRPTLLALD